MFQIFAMKIKVFLRHFFVKLFELFCGIWTMHVTSTSRRMTVACKYNIFICPDTYFNIKTAQWPYN